MIVPLEWDSHHFGFSVARAEPAGLSTTELESDLASARSAGTRLVYHRRPASETLADATLSEFGGRPLTTGIFFEKSLAAGRREIPEGVSVETAACFDESLRQLAPLCGHYSRFRADPGIPDERFVLLYEIWLERSVKGEMAERVLVAREPAGDVLGFNTVVRTDSTTGRLGMMAVSAAARGRGVATALVAAAEQTMTASGCERTEVSTHVENEAACRLFESFAYEAVGTPERAYHFWLEPTR